MVFNTIQGLAEYNPAIRELFECPVQINVDLDLDYQAKRQWDFVSPKNGESLSSFFDVSFLPRVRDASECLRLIETAVDLGSVLHSAADKHEVSTPEVFVALQRTLVLKRSLLLILKNLFILGTSVIQPDVAKDLLRRISEPLRTLTAFDIDFDKIKEVKLKDFLYLDQKRCINDEVMNYFCSKWTRMWPTKRVIALTTFFSAKALFEHGKPREQRRTGFSRFDKVFVPIHEPSGHWFSALIDYEEKKIEIYDSWGPTYEQNSGRNVKDQVHAPLMLVLMWAAELWSSIRGIEDEPTFELGGDKDSGWTYDPHALVDFQDNDFDCGIHVLDHLNRILRGKNLNRKDELTLKYHQRSFHLKRILLAHELYDDAKCPIV
ncbi:cysteine proteinase [Gymnopus androsaceus JB14]|uniref:Cysteine proteinase n=1 Tax=Gymnopus androsaceus JB14 TaxID=1447944 RepID=A0A6A4GEC7_9AGAR|nr:cysteine proteinase [Gymnopus androsaceus JB14]